MLRRVLTYQLILAVAVGPLLCCCSAGKVLAGSPQISKSPAPGGARVPVERVSHACCSHKHQPANSDPGQKSAPSKPAAPADKCPCKDGSDKTQTAQLESAQGGLSSFLRVIALDLDTVGPFGIPTAVASGPCGSACRSRAAGPHLTTAELLYAHHKLRC